MRLANSRNPLRRTHAPAWRRRPGATLVALTVFLAAAWAPGAQGPSQPSESAPGSAGAAATDPFAAVTAPGPLGGAQTGDRPATPGTGAHGPASTASTGSSALPAPSAPPPAAPAGPPVTRRLDVRSGTVTLTGTLLLPAGPGPFPAVVLLPGRGNVGRGQAAADARLFASHGIAAYAYDKRGTGASSGDWRRSLNPSDEVGDAVAAVAAVRRQPGVDPSRVGVWGVGQGAWLAPFVGEHADVAFLILLNTSAASLGQEEVWRAGDAVRARGYSPTAADAAMRGVRLLVSTRPVLAALLPPSQLGFLKDDPSSTPADALKQAKAPTLLVYDDLDPRAPGVKPTVALLQAAQNRDQPLDHVSVLARAGPGAEGAGAGGDPGSALANARRAADPTYRSVIVGWTTTVVRSLAPAGGRLAMASATSGSPALTGASGLPGPPAQGAPGPAAGRGPAGDPALLLPGSSDRPASWYSSPWVQLGAAVFFLIAFGEGLLLSVLPRRRRRSDAGGDVQSGGARRAEGHARRSRAAGLLRVTQALVSLVDLALLAGMTVAIAFLLGLYQPAGLSLQPLAAGLRLLSALSGALAVALAVLILLARRSARAPRTTVAVVVAVAAALFLPFLVYWHVPFLAG